MVIGRGADIHPVAAGSGDLVRRVMASLARPLADGIGSVGGEAIDGDFVSVRKRSE